MMMSLHNAVVKPEYAEKAIIEQFGVASDIEFSARDNNT
jgi:hypothetical protein